MGEPFLGEIRLMSFNFPPKGWALCNGQLLPINVNQALFSILGTMYGGDGRTTFALPDLRDRVPLAAGQGAGLSDYQVGQAGGEATHTLTANEYVSHSHTVKGTRVEGNTATPGGTVLPAVGTGAYSQAAPDGAMASGALSTAGGGQPHENRQPFLAMNYVIALQGIFPSQS